MIYPLSPQASPSSFTFGNVPKAAERLPAWVTGADECRPATEIPAMQKPHSNGLDGVHAHPPSSPELRSLSHRSRGFGFGAVDSSTFWRSRGDEYAMLAHADE